MPWNLLKYGLSRKRHGPAHFPAQPELKSAYDVVIIGAGGHGLAAAYARRAKLALARAPRQAKRAAQRYKLVAEAIDGLEHYAAPGLVIATLVASIKRNVSLLHPTVAPPPDP